MLTERPTLDFEKLNRVSILAVNAARDRKFPFEQGDLHPESGFIEIVKQVEVEKKLDGLTLNALFLITTCAFAEDTNVFFRRFSLRNRIEENVWIFNPAEVTKRIPNEVFQATLNFIEPGGYNVDALKEWHHNCSILHFQYEDNVTKFFEENNNNARKIYNALIVKPQARNKIGFRRFGEKLAALFIQWVKRYNLYELGGHAGVPVDRRVGQIAMQTEAIISTVPVHKNVMTNLLRPAFDTVVSETDIDPAEISQSFYTIGNRACSKKLHRNCPLKDVCSRLISLAPLDEKGIFDPKDTGRYKGQV